MSALKSPAGLEFRNGPRYRDVDFVRKLALNVVLDR